MVNKENDMHQPRSSILSVSFDDGSVFNLSKDWEDVFADYLGANPEFYPKIVERLKFITSKYVKHSAWLSEFDDIKLGIEDDEIPDVAYDDLEFYWEHWNESKPHIAPKWADVAEAVLYQTMRGGLLQKALQQLGSNTIVTSPKRFLRN